MSLDSKTLKSRHDMSIDQNDVPWFGQFCDALGHVIRDCPKKKAFDAFDANSPTTAGFAFTEPDDDNPYSLGYMVICLWFFLDLRYGSPTGIDSDRAYAFVGTSFVVYLSVSTWLQGEQGEGHG
ncbi:hypothetical protein K435DRAFT_845901 [Dendrothele bispora CBS 962.96]|uniref:CCHC-type domain-containing protein n=1 Tax=Dendrothele bispora (strain CBS 962.96) TaxID=1314807 RepID=A0A4S8KQZ8_DENBC|nr:hypothetical protein K435DRAFT_845901 [Dendrothele bispora CBS 962.96]